MLTVKHVQIYNIKNGTKYNNGTNAHNNHMVDALELYIQENSHLINPRQMKLNMLSYETSSSNDYLYMKNFEFKFSNCDPIIYLSNGIELSIENEENHSEKTVTTTRFEFLI